MIGITLALFCLTCYFILWRKSKNIPPGPPRIPILGSIPFISVKRGLLDWVLDKTVTIHKLATVGIGPRNLYVINDFELAKKLFGKDEYSGRFISDFFLSHKGFDGKKYGIIMTEGSHWKRERTFGLKTLKNFGLGKQSFEETINIEVDDLINIFVSKNEDFHLNTDFNVPIINILWQLVAGDRFTPDDSEGMEMIESVNRMFKITFKMDVIPLQIMKMFPKLTDYQEMIDIYDIQKRYIFKQIEEHEQTHDPEHPRDYIDVYLNEMQDEKSSEDFNKKDLAVSMWDFLHAGTETSSTTLKWIVLYLTLYQDVQDK